MKLLGPRFRLELQTESADCGLACVAMLAGYHGFAIELRELKSRFTVSAYGLHLLTLKKILQELKFSCQTVRFDPERPEVLQTPCILHWGDAHFVVLSKIGRTRLTLFDPSRGKRKISRQAFIAGATGFALEAERAADFEPKARDRRSVIRPFLRGLGLQGFVLRLLVVSGIIQATSLALPFFAQTVFDEAVPVADFSLVILLALSFCGLSIFSAILRALYAWGSEYLKNRMTFIQHQRLFGMLLEMPLRFFDRRANGDLLGAFMSLERIKEVFAQGVLQVFTSSILFVALFFVMWAYSPWLLGFVAVVSALRIGVSYGFFFILNRQREETFHLQTRLNTRVLELISVMQPIKIFSRQSLAKDLYRSALDKKLDCELHMKRLGALERMVIQTLETLDHIFFISVAATFLIGGQMSFGQFFAFSLYKAQFQRSFSELLELVISFKSLSIFRNWLGDIVFQEQEETARRALEPEAEYALCLENVSFRYSKYEPYIFENMNLRIEPGESVAIIGPSGRGKTTLCKLILGLLEAESGWIRLGRPSIGKSAISAAMQNDQLLSASIRDNISFFDAECAPERVSWAAQQANILSEIESLPLGLDTIIGDSIANLSGGQRQRILLARALYQRPSVLLLDESTSNLDVLNERIISGNIKRMKISRVIFSHRPETIATCDRVITLDELDHMPKTHRRDAC